MLAFALASQGIMHTMNRRMFLRPRRNEAPDATTPLTRPICSDIELPPELAERHLFELCPHAKVHRVGDRVELRMAAK